MFMVLHSVYLPNIFGNGAYNLQFGQSNYITEPFGNIRICVDLTMNQMLKL